MEGESNEYSGTMGVGSTSSHTFMHTISFLDWACYCIHLHIHFLGKVLETECPWFWFHIGPIICSPHANNCALDYRGHMWQHSKGHEGNYTVNSWSLLNHYMTVQTWNKMFKITEKPLKLHNCFCCLASYAILQYPQHFCESPTNKGIYKTNSHFFPSKPTLVAVIFEIFSVTGKI